MVARASAFSRQDFSISSCVCSTFTSSITIWETVQRKEMHLWGNESTADHIYSPIHHAGTVLYRSNSIEIQSCMTDAHFRYKHQLGSYISNSHGNKSGSIVMFSSIFFTVFLEVNITLSSTQFMRGLSNPDAQKWSTNAFYYITYFKGGNSNCIRL